ncbi:MAG: lysozyme [Pseudomonadota bacterium]
MKTGPAGLALIMEFEGLRLDAYPDPATKGEPWTIGYGHTAAAGEPKPVRGMKITAAEAVKILQRDLGLYERAVMACLDRMPNQNQFDAMVSLCFNIGPGNFRTSSVVRYFNAGDEARAAERFLVWNKANKKVMKGLERRREAERKLFDTPVKAPPKPVEPPPPIQPPAPPPPAPPPRAGFWAWFKGLFS